MRRIRTIILALIGATGVLTVLAPAVPAAAAQVAQARPTLRITQVAAGLTIPWDVAQTPDGTLIFDQRSGGLSVRRPDGTVASLSADFSDLYAIGETGLMGLVLDPRFRDEPALLHLPGPSGRQRPGDPGHHLDRGRRLHRGHPGGRPTAR